MASNLEEDVTKEASQDQPSDETKGEETTPSAETKAGQKTQPGDEVDYKTKFSESSKEAQRLLDENRRLKAELDETSDVMSVIYEDKELLGKVQKKYDSRYNPTSESDSEPEQTGRVAEAALEKKVQEKVSPISQELQEIRKQHVDSVVKDFKGSHPDVEEGSDQWNAMMEWLPAMKAKGLPLRDGLEKAYELTAFDKAKQSGKVDALRDIFTKQQAAAAGGSSATASKAQAPDESLSSEERKVAESLGIKPEKYAKSKQAK